MIELDRRITKAAPAQLATEGLLDELRADEDLKNSAFTAVGYGTVRETRKMAWQSPIDRAERRFWLQSVNALRPFWLQLSMTQATDDAGTCFGDSGCPPLPGRSDVEPAGVDHRDRRPVV